MNAPLSDLPGLPGIPGLPGLPGDPGLPPGAGLPAGADPAPAAVPRHFRTALARTRGAQKSSVGAAAYSRWVNRPLGRVLASAAHVVHATPNQVTAVSCAVTALGLIGIAVLRPTWPVSLGCAVLLALGYALDAADGQLARLRGGGSVAGEWLDHVGDAVKEPGLHLVVLVCWYRFYDLRPAWLLLPIGFALVSSVMFFSVMLTAQLRRGARPAAPAAAPAGRAPVWRSLVVAPGDYGVFCLVVALLPVMHLYVGVYGVLLAFWVLFLLAAWRSWFRELSRL